MRAEHGLILAVAFGAIVAVLIWIGTQAHLPGALRGEEGAASRLGFWLGAAGGLAVVGTILTVTLATARFEY
jgi:hypothetical protein